MTKITTNLELSSSEDDTIHFGVCKYKNIMGVTCYMNSILHIMQQLPFFAEYIAQAKFKDSILQKIKPDQPVEEAIKKLVIFELFRLFKTSLENDDDSITPTTFRTMIGTKNDMWTDHIQQDSQEFFTFLISVLQEEVGMKCKFIPGGVISDTLPVLDPNTSIHNIISVQSLISFQQKEYSPLNNLFDGLIENNKRCYYCSSQNYKFEPFITLGLSVPIKNRFEMTKEFSIYDCFDHLIMEEQLDSENKITCEFCGLKNRSFNQTMLWKTPKILVIHIKRFMVNQYGICTQKITNNVVYPFKNLDLTKYFNPNSPHKSKANYDLVGINVHQAMGHGNNVNAGHYTSIVKNIMNHNWYLYNDSQQLEIAQTKKHLQNQNAYMLFYCQV